MSFFWGGGHKWKEFIAKKNITYQYVNKLHFPPQCLISGIELETFLLLTYFPTYLPIYRTYFFHNGLQRWNHILTQLKFIHNRVITSVVQFFLFKLFKRRWKHLEKILMYVKGTLYPWLSLLKLGGILCLLLKGWEGYSHIFPNSRISEPNSKTKSRLIHRLHTPPMQSWVQNFTTH